MTLPDSLQSALDLSAKAVDIHPHHDLTLGHRRLIWSALGPSTGGIGPADRGSANRVMGASNLCIVMMNRADIGEIANNPAVIVDVFNREAEHATKLKAVQW
jgi:hypothetical protein